MITLLRLDERLIHGQVAIKWSQQSATDRILVINDEAANTSIIKRSLMMAAPGSIKTAIKGVEEGINILNDPRMENVKVLVLVSEIEDLLELTEKVPGITDINIGNYGRIAPKKDGEERKTYRSHLYLYEDEADMLREIMDAGITCTYQTTPEDPKEPLEKIINKGDN